MKGRLSKKFFQEKTALQLAKSLIGCILVYETPSGVVSGVICETEAYDESDIASQSFGGRRTKKNEVMFLDGGHIYVYFTYGMHYCINVVSGYRDEGSAVLIRSISLISGVDIARKNRSISSFPSDSNLTNGPAKLSQALGIDKRHNGVNLTDRNSPLYIKGGGLDNVKIKKTKRIGISKGKDKLWRFVVFDI